MEHTILKTLSSLVLIIILSACSSTKVTLLPDDNQDSQITVSNDAGNEVVNKAGDRVSVGSESAQPSAPSAVEIEKIKSKHASLFSIQPEKADTFLLYFEHNDTVLRDTSNLLIEKIIAAAKARNFPQINVIGHSDAAGDSEYNMQLSYRRAKAIEQRLEAANIENAEYRIDSHGENDPLVKSGRQMEPKNRRVEVQVW